MADTATATEAPKKKANGPFLRGEGSLRQLTIVATVYDNGIREPRELPDGRMSKGGAFVNGELARFANTNDKVGPQYDPALSSEKTTDENGKTWYNKSSFYGTDSVGAMREAAAAQGNASQVIYRHVDGKPTDERIGEILVFDADVFPRKEGGYGIKVDSISPTSVTVPENVQQAQFDQVGADRTQLRAEAAEKAKAKEAEAPAAEPKETEKSAEGPEY